MKITSIITAGGTSQRYGNRNKLFEKISEKEVIKYAVEAFLNVEEICAIVICAHVSIMGYLEELFKKESKICIIQGGDTRQESVYNGLLTVPDSDYVLIHDGARPVISEATIRQAILDVQTKKALTVVTKTTDTIKKVDETGKIVKTIDRKQLYNTQTPQAFEYKLIMNAHEVLKGQSFTDDAGMLESLGEAVYILEGGYENIKITTQADLALAEIYLKN